MTAQRPMSFAHLQRTVTLNISVRPARRGDLPHLEWWGQFAQDRELIRWMFRRHLRRQACMLVADTNGYGVGQAWVEGPNGDTGVGAIWAVRVFPCLQHHGIGAMLVQAGEELLLARGATGVEVETHVENHAARRLYEQLGYRVPQSGFAGALCPMPGRRFAQQVLLRKALVAVRAERARPSREVA